MSKTRIRPKRRTQQPSPPAIPNASHVPAVAPSPNAPAFSDRSGWLDDYLREHAPEVVAVSYGVIPDTGLGRQTVTVRLSGRRLDVDGRPGPRDRFSYTEAVSGVEPGHGRFTVTVKVPGVAAGRWAVDGDAFATAEGRPARVPSVQRRVQASPVRWSWRRWRVVDADDRAVASCLAPFARTPASLLGSWTVLALLGIATALTVQRAMSASSGVAAGRALAASLVAVPAGIVGAKLWFVVVHRRDGRREGWCIQGLVVAVGLVLPLLAWAIGAPVGALLDATAGALLFGMAVGRVGCFLTGCCAGRPTRSRWGVWSSDRRLSMRRVPTQLLEAAAAASVGAAAAVAVLLWGGRHGTVFVAAVAAYTLLRQAVLRYRAEPRTSRIGSPATAAVAAAILLVDLVAAITAT